MKKKRYIPFDRIQSLDYTEGILHRPLKLVKVKVETAGSSSARKSEAELTAITKEEASRIEAEIAEAKKKKKDYPDRGEEKMTGNIRWKKWNLNESHFYNVDERLTYLGNDFRRNRHHLIGSVIFLIAIC